MLPGIITRAARHALVAALCAALLTGCTAETSAPTASSDTPTDPALTVVTFTGDRQTTDRETVYHLTMQFREVSGLVGITIVAITFTLDTGGSVTVVPSGANSRIEAGLSRTLLVDLHDARKSIATHITASVSFTNDLGQSSTVASSLTLSIT
jgi:hypothetical protein